MSPSSFGRTVRKTGNVLYRLQTTLKWNQPPHRVEQSSILHDPQQLVGHRHVVGHRLLAVVKEGVGGPDLTGHQVVERKNVHWTVEL